VGEVGRFGPPGRREIGHGKLAWRALQAVLPAATDFPYTIRIVSEITESNGSSSMATVCGGSLSMMDAGVPLKAPVAGVAMGLILEDDGRFAVLSDILGDEDHLGDMDFKVAGTENGITSLQMDIKVAASPSRSWSRLDMFKVGIGPSSSTRWARWSPPRASWTGCAPRPSTPRAARLAARLAGLHRGRPCHRPRRDPRPRRLPAPTLRRRPGRGRAARDPRHEAIEPAGLPPLPSTPRATCISTTAPPCPAMPTG
jgi:hypothetical protein